MGADGRISIWAADKVRAEWPDCDYFFRLLPTAYLHLLEGKEYYHLYIGDNIIVRWPEEEDWMATDNCSEDFLERMRDFVDWLLRNEDAEWEVWT